MASHLIKREMPFYPASEGPYRSGTVVTRATVSPEGKANHFTVISGPESLRRRALEAMRGWTYKPFVLNGKPVWVQTIISMNLDFGG